MPKSVQKHRSSGIGHHAPYPLSPTPRPGSSIFRMNTDLGQHVLRYAFAVCCSIYVANLFTEILASQMLL